MGEIDVKVTGGDEIDPFREPVVKTVRVWVCKSRDDGSVVDVLDQSVHAILTPDTIKTFDCTDEEWDEKDFNDLKYIPSPTALQDATPEEIAAELVKRQLADSFDTILQAAMKPISPMKIGGL